MNKNRVGEVKVDLVKTSLRTLGLQSKYVIFASSELKQSLLFSSGNRYGLGDLNFAFLIRTA